MRIRLNTARVYPLQAATLLQSAFDLNPHPLHVRSVEVVVRSEGLGSQPVSNAHVRRWAEAMLHAVQRQDAELSVLLCSDEIIHTLNRDFRNKDSPTDVLGFAMNEGEASHVQTHILGDIVISLPTARRQAAEHQRTIASEVRWLLAHGLLHLLGFDHQTFGEYRRMMARQDVLVCATAP